MSNENNSTKAKRTTIGLSRYSCKNLQFMLEFLRAIDKTPETAMKTASAAVSFRAQLHQDNMLLSRARKIIEEQGYKLEVQFKDKEQENEVISIILEDTPERERKVVNLDFLEKMLTEKRMTMAMLSEKIGIASQTVRTWFRVDDIRIGYLTEIAEKLNMILEYKITKA